ncbi:WD40-repeat-containing domain protein [Chaetomium sp. MPI-SDFR-AT-0129]|nr:WD40-repeat-containing domain protein [Chaetomium sp. MPI-SDFR-AT-0129]
MTQRGAPRFPTRPVAQLLGSNGPVHAVAYSATPGTYILAGSSDRSIRLYNPSSTTSIPSTGSSTGNNSSSSNSITARSSHTPPQPPAGKLIQTYTSHTYEVLSLAISPSNARFVSAGGDRAVLLWDVATAQAIRRLGASSTAHSHTGRVNAVCFAGLGGNDDDEANLVVSGGLDATVRLWDLRSHTGGSGGKPIQVLQEARDAVTALAVDGADGAQILAASVDGRVRTYDVRMGRCVTDVFPASVTSLSLARDGKTVLVGSLDSKIRLMDRRDGSCLRTYAAGGAAGGDNMPDDEVSSGGWRNEELRVQSVLGGGERFVVAGDELSSPSSASSSSSLENEKNKMGSTAENTNEGKVWAWDVMTGKLIATLPVPWGGGSESRKRVIGRDGKEKERKNVVSCIAWKDGGFGDQFCVGGTSGVVTVFGE